MVTSKWGVRLSTSRERSQSSYMRTWLLLSLTTQNRTTSLSQQLIIQWHLSTTDRSSKSRTRWEINWTIQRDHASVKVNASAETVATLRSISTPATPTCLSTLSLVELTTLALCSKPSTRSHNDLKSKESRWKLSRSTDRISLLLQVSSTTSPLVPTALTLLPAMISILPTVPSSETCSHPTSWLSSKPWLRQTRLTSLARSTRASAEKIQYCWRVQSFRQSCCNSFLYLSLPRPKGVLSVWLS